MGQLTAVENNQATGPRVKANLEVKPKADAPVYASKVEETERHPLLDHPDPRTQQMVLEGIRPVLAQGLASGTKLIPQATELLNSEDLGVRSEALKMLGDIGKDLLAREKVGSAAMRKAAYEARVDILTNLARVTLNEKEPKEFTNSARAAVRLVTTADEQKSLRASLGGKTADAVLGAEALKLPK